MKSIYGTCRRLAVSVFILCSAWSQAAWAQDKGYVVRLREARLPEVAAGSLRDDRFATEPEAWGYLEHKVVAEATRLERRHAFKLTHVFSRVMKGFSARLTPAQLAALRQEPSVEAIEEEQEFRTNAPKAPGPQVVPWGIDKIDADLSYTVAGNGSGAISGVGAYVIDTGVGAHGELNLVRHVNFAGDGRNADCNGHGTHVAGTLGAYDNPYDVVGVAPGVALHGVKVLGCAGSGTTSSVIKGVDWVAANALGPAVANMSLGGGASAMLDGAVRAAMARGIFFSIAAGNSGASACNYSPARIGGNSPGVLVVAATDSNDAETSWSNYGDCVDVWAPGLNILSTKKGGGTTTMSGTSMASPHAGGAAALYWGRYPTATASAVWTYLKEAAYTSSTNLSKDGNAVVRLVANVQ